MDRRCVVLLIDDGTTLESGQPGGSVHPTYLQHLQHLGICWHSSTQWYGYFVSMYPYIIYNIVSCNVYIYNTYK